MKRVIWVMLFASTVCFSQEKPKPDSLVTVSVDSLKKQIGSVNGEFQYWTKVVSEQEAVIDEANKKIFQARTRQTFLNGFANGLQAVISDSTLHRRKSKGE